MGGSSGLNPFSGNGLKNFTTGLKAANPFTNHEEHKKLMLDPGGLFHTSSNEDIANLQGVLDTGGFGADQTLEQRATDKAMAEQAAEVNKQAANAQSMLDERRARMARKQKGRASLLSGTERGVELKSTLG